MRHAIVILLGVACQLGSFACDDDDDDDEDVIDRAHVRVVQAVLDAPELDVYVSRAASVAAFPQLARGSASGYVGLDDGDYEMIARVPDTDEVLAEFPIDLAERQHILVVVSGLLAPAEGQPGVTIAVYDDTIVDAGAGRSQLRFINSTLDAAPLTVELTNEIVDNTSVTYGPLGSTADAVATVTADKALQLNVNDPDYRVDETGTPVVDLNDNGMQFTTPTLASTSAVAIVAIGSTSAAQSDANAFRFLVLPAVTPSNTTVVDDVARNPYAVFVNGIPGESSTIAVVGGESSTLAFGAASAPQQIPLALTVSVGERSASITGGLDPAVTYVIVATVGDDDALSLFAYQDALAAATDTRIRAINATVGAGSRDISLEPELVLGTDVVFGAATTSAGIVVSAPESVTRTLAVGTSSTLAYSTPLTTTARYIVLVGNIATPFGATTLSVSGDTWTSTFVSGTSE